MSNFLSRNPNRMLQFLGKQWPKLVIGGAMIGTVALAPQICSASLTCEGVFGGDSMATSQTSKLMRGLEGVDIPSFQSALTRGDAQALSAWYDVASKVDGDQASPFSGKVFSKSKTDLVDSNGAKANGSFTQITRLARQTATRALRQQIQIQKDLGLNPDAKTLSRARRQIYLLQFMAEEALVYASRLDSKSPTSVVIKGASLTPAELSNSGSILQIPVVPGDVVIQMSANALSSNFISHSQSNPGLASHSSLIVDTNGHVVKLEALIEDGVNLRELKDESTVHDVAQLWVVSLKDASDRARAGGSTQAFVKENQIPLVGPGIPTVRSPLRYDATMNPAMMDKGAYYCTTLVEKVYMETGLGGEKVPFRPDETNWTSLSGIEAEVYHTLSITRPRVAAPSDVFVNGAFEIRGTTINVPAMINGRRLHATVDAMFTALASQPALKKNLLHQVESLPDMSIDKQQVLQILDQALVKAKDQSLVSASEIARIQAMRGQILAALPEHATLRQVVFFYYLNNILQARMMTALTTFEEAQPNHFASAIDLRREAEKTVSKELKSAASVLGIVNAVIPKSIVGQ